MSEPEKTFEFIVNEEDSDVRLDRFLANILPEYSRTFIQKLIKGEKVLVGGKLSKPSYLLEPQDVIHLTIPPAEAAIPEPEPIPLDIVYEDAHLIVVNKPAGMIVHPGAGNVSGTLVNALLHHYQGLSSIGGVQRPGIVHRIDKNTTGLLVIARTDVAHRNLATQLAKRTLKRYYLALVAGEFDKDEGIVDAPVGRSERHREYMMVNYKNGREAITHYKVVKRSEGITLLGITLETGRTHQIRVHMNFIRHPVIGDPDYGWDMRMAIAGVPPSQSLLLGKLKKVKTQLLHAACLQLVHPEDGRLMTFEAPPPPHFAEIIELL